MWPWVTWGLIELSQNIRETKGTIHHPRIIEYHHSTTLKATEDEVSWCSSAINCCMLECGLPGTMSALARSWLGWGEELSEFRFGAIAVFWRGEPHSVKGHVGIALAEESGIITLLGGNQGNAFSIAKYPKSQLLSYRWPIDFSLEKYYPTVS